MIEDWRVKIANDPDSPKWYVWFILAALLIAASLLFSCEKSYKDYSCEECLLKTSVINIDTVRMYAGANHNSTISISYILSIGDTLDVDVSGTIEIKVNGGTYQRTLTIPAGRFFTQLDTQDGPRNGWDIYTLSMRITNASPIKGSTWILKY